MVADNGKVQIQRDVCIDLFDKLAPPPALRVALGLMHAQELIGTWRYNPVAGPPPAFFEETAVIRARVSPGRTNDNRMFHAALPWLEDHRTLFDEIDLLQGGQYIRWRASPELFERMAERIHSYALLDFEIIRSLRSDAQHAAYLLTQVHIRKLRPKFEIRINPEVWRTQRQAFLRAFERLAPLMNAEFHVASCFAKDRPVLEWLVIKAVTETTKWAPKALKKFPPNRGVVIIAPGGKRIKQRTLAEIEAIHAGRVLPPP